MAHQIQIKELVNGIEITENLDGVIVVKMLSYNSRPFFRTTNETDEESYQVIDTLGEIYHLPALATEFVLIDLEDNYWIPEDGVELIQYSYKIRAFRPENEFDRVLSLGTIETTSNSVNVDIPGVGLTNSFLINGSIYELYYPSLFNFSPIVGTGGEQKILILYAKPDTTILYLAQGAEALEAVEPNYDGLFVARIIVNAEGQVVEEEDNKYKRTSSDGWRTYQIATNDPFIVDMGNSYASSFAIDVLPGVTAPKIGLVRQKGDNRSFWDGSPFFFRNISGIDIEFVEETYTNNIFTYKTFESNTLKAGLDKEFKLRNNVLTGLELTEPIDLSPYALNTDLDTEIVNRALADTNLQNQLNTANLLIADLQATQITITTTSSITTDTLSTVNSRAQNGKNVIIDNGVNAINLQCLPTSPASFCASYSRLGSGAVTITAGSGVTVEEVYSGSGKVCNGAIMSSFTLERVGTKFYLKLNNA